MPFFSKKVASPMRDSVLSSPHEDFIVWNVFVTDCWKLIPISDFKSLWLLSKNFHKLVSPIKQKYYIYKIPRGQTLTQAFPQNVLVYEIDSIPASTISVTFRDTFNASISTSSTSLLPPSVTSLLLGNKFNQKVNMLPASLTSLHFGFEFNQQFNFSANTKLTHLTFGYSFRQEISSSNLPPSLHHLTLGATYNTPLTTLPSKLQKLTLGMDFNKPLTSLPPSLTHLELMTSFNQPISASSLPPLLTHLSFDYRYQQSRFNNSLDDLPPSLVYLAVFGEFNQIINKYPPKITTLILEGSYSKPLFNLPSSLTSLRLGNYFHESLPSPFPSSLTSLVVGYVDKSAEERMIKETKIPSSITYFKVGSKLIKDTTRKERILEGLHP